MENSFYWKRGKFETTNPWLRPNYDSIKAMLIDLRDNTDIFKKYKLKIIGKVLVDITNTWDLDLHMYNIDGSINIPDELENDMNIIYHYGIDRHRVLPDISWQNCELYNISKTDYFSGNYTSTKHHRVKTVNFLKKVNGIIEFEHREPVDDTRIFLNEDLVLIEHMWPVFDDTLFKVFSKYRVEDHFVLENQLHVYDTLDFINSTQKSFLMETNPLYRKTSKIM